MLRALKKGELSLKDMSVLREGESARVQHKKNFGQIKDYGVNHIISMVWKENGARQGPLPFELKIDDAKFRLSWAELKDLDRAGFFRCEVEGSRSVTLKRLDGPKIRLTVGTNEDAERDMIVQISAHNIEAYVDWYEVLRYGRFV